MVEFSVTTRVAGFVCSCHSRRVCGGFRLGGPFALPAGPCQTSNLVLDVLAQLLEDAFDVLGRAVLGKCP